MKIKFTDALGEAFSNIEVTFSTSGNEAVYITDIDGIVEFFEAEKGDKVTCYIDIQEKRDFVFSEKEIPVIKLNAPLVDMAFVTIGKEEDAITGATVIFEYLDIKVEKTSDNTGQILLEKVPLNTNVKVYQLHNDIEKNIEINKCRKDKAQYFIVTEKFFEVSDMKFKLVDKSGQIIRNADIRFRVGESEFETVTDHLGVVVIENIKLGDTVECKQMMFGKSLPWHKFKCEEMIDEYILHGEKASLYAQNSDKFESQVRMRFRLLNSKMQPIPNAVLRLEYGVNVRNKYTNQSGEAMVDDVLIGDKINAMVALQGKKTEAEFICQKDDEMHEIIFKSNFPLIYLWIIPIIIVIAVIVYLASANTDEEKMYDEEVIEKKDTVIIHDYSFYISGTKKGLPIADSKIKLFYTDAVTEQLTDKNGYTKFATVNEKLPLKYEISAFGYITLNKTFVLDSIFKIKLLEDDSLDIAGNILPCSTTVESKGLKTSIQSFKMNSSKGRFKIWCNMFSIPGKIEVYNGKLNSNSDKNLAFTTNGFLTGITNPGIEFASADSIITVKITGNAAKTTWVYKVFCAKQNLNVIPK